MSDEQKPEGNKSAFQDTINPSHEDYADMFPTEIDNNEDPVAIDKRKKKIRAIVASSLLVAVVLIIGFFVLRIYADHQEQREQLEAEEEQRLREEAERAEFDPNLPLLDAYGDETVPTTDATSIALSVADGDLQSSEDYTLAHSEYNFQAPEVECSVSRATDFCFSGELNTGDDTPEVHGYFLKDAPNSRMLEHAESFSEVAVSGANKAAVMTIELGGESTPSLVVVNDDGSGHLLTAPGANLQDLEGLSQDLSVS